MLNDADEAKDHTDAIIDLLVRLAAPRSPQQEPRTTRNHRGLSVTCHSDLVAILRKVVGEPFESHLLHFFPLPKRPIRYNPTQSIGPHALNIRAIQDQGDLVEGTRQTFQFASAGSSPPRGQTECGPPRGRAAAGSRRGVRPGVPPRGQTEFQVNLKLGLTPCPRRSPAPISSGLCEITRRDRGGIAGDPPAGHPLPPRTLAESRRPEPGGPLPKVSDPRATSDRP
jgi:hypothetical protein